MLHRFLSCVLILAAPLCAQSQQDWQPPAEADLPAGFPAPTAPGEIEIKLYPVSRAVVSEQRGFFELGIWKAFRPLFLHIQAEEISMTSPVLANYPEEAEARSRGTMQVGFFYPSTALGQTGSGGGVAVTDVPAQTVVSLGMRSSYSMSSYRDAVAELEAWLQDNAALWEAAGPPRRLMYQQPKLRNMGSLYSEVQIPLRSVLAPGHD